jgi:hypothetical protein
MTDELSTVRNILKRNQAQLLGQSNVVAAGIGYKVTAGKKTTSLGILCSVREKMASTQLSHRDVVPRMLDGIPTDVIRTGPIRALQGHTGRIRPAPGGVSLGHRDITAGTLGCLVTKGGETFILSNNHVLANSNEAVLGDPILQPGPYDGGRLPEDHIANLEQFVPISYIGSASVCSMGRGITDLVNNIAKALGSHLRLQIVSEQVGENLVDAAIARPIKPEDVSEEILEIGPIQGMKQGELSMAVKKSGRTTGLTTGEILQVDVSVNVQYGQNQIARFSDQLMAGPMSQGGDSGSAVLDEGNHLVGLLFAGSDNSTIINRIGNVFSALEVGI